MGGTREVCASTRRGTINPLWRAITSQHARTSTAASRCSCDEIQVGTTPPVEQGNKGTTGGGAVGNSAVSAHTRQSQISHKRTRLVTRDSGVGGKKKKKHEPHQSHHRMAPPHAQRSITVQTAAESKKYSRTTNVEQAHVPAARA